MKESYEITPPMKRRLSGIIGEKLALNVINNFLNVGKRTTGTREQTKEYFIFPLMDQERGRLTNYYENAVVRLENARIREELVQQFIKKLSFHETKFAKINLKSINKLDKLNKEQLIIFLEKKILSEEVVFEDNPIDEKKEELKQKKHEQQYSTNFQKKN